MHSSTPRIARSMQSSKPRNPRSIKRSPTKALSQPSQPYHRPTRAVPQPLHPLLPPFVFLTAPTHLNRLSLSIRHLPYVCVQASTGRRNFELALTSSADLHLEGKNDQATNNHDQRGALSDSSAVTPSADLHLKGEHDQATNNLEQKDPLFDCSAVAPSADLYLEGKNDQATNNHELREPLVDGSSAPSHEHPLELVNAHVARNRLQRDPTLDSTFTPSAQGGTPSAQGSTPLAQGATPSAQGGTPSAQGGTPSAQGATPSAQARQSEPAEQRLETVDELATYSQESCMEEALHELEAVYRQLRGDGTHSMLRVTKQELWEFLKGKTMPDGSGPWKCSIRGRMKDIRQLLADAIQVLRSSPTHTSGATRVASYTPEWCALALVRELEVAFRELQGNGTPAETRVTVPELLTFLKGKMMLDGSGPMILSPRGKRKDKKQLLVDAIEVLTAPPARPSKASQIECYTPNWYALALVCELEVAFRELQGNGTPTELRVTGRELVAFLTGKTMPDGSGPWKLNAGGGVKNKRQLLVDAIQVLRSPQADTSGVSQVASYPPKGAP